MFFRIPFNTKIEKRHFDHRRIQIDNLFVGITMIYECNVKSWTSNKSNSISLLYVMTNIGNEGNGAKGQRVSLLEWE